MQNRLLQEYPPTANSKGGKKKIHKMNEVSQMAEAPRTPPRSGDWVGEDNKSRLVSKSGEQQVTNRIHRRSWLRAYLWYDLFTSLVDSRWRRIFYFGTALYCSIWVGFAFLYAIALGEFGCMSEEVVTLMDALLLSIDAQTTIGFGNYAIESECTGAVFVLIVQCLLSTFCNAAFMGLVYAKIARPQRRAATICFSRCACIATDKDGVRVLSIRVADQRKHLLVGASARLLLYQATAADVLNAQESYSDSEEPPRLEVNVTPLKLESAEVFLLLPFILKHRIDEKSPLWSCSLEDLSLQRAELIVLLEGYAATTSQLVQARQSYLPSELLMGHEFEPCCTLRDDGGYEIDFDTIHATRPAAPRAVATPDRVPSAARPPPSPRAPMSAAAASSNTPRRDANGL
mmetsp:Transcript_55841/g.132515  ORF Transcript_55841/g.132515 Transcript_55841/m.132515 type:complete len:402 (+) Transcript_55841:222-1427(+)